MSVRHLIRFVEQSLLLCLLLCFCGVSPGWPGLGATGLGVCCRPCWGLRTLRACESANETGLYLPSSRLAYPPTSQAPEAPTATPSAQTLEDPTSPATGTDSSDAGHLICLSSTVDGLEWREEILRRFGEVHNCMLCFWTPQQHTSRPSRRGSVTRARTRAAASTVTAIGRRCTGALRQRAVAGGWVRVRRISKYITADTLVSIPEMMWKSCWSGCRSCK